MSRFRRFAFRLGSLFHLRRIEEELAEELRVHLELQTEANLRSGMPLEKARREAFKDLGGVDQVKERYRDERRLRWLEDVGGDLRQAVYRLGRERTFTAAIVTVFALCVAANVAIFSVVHGVLLKPLPFDGAAGIYAVYDSYPKAGFDGGTSVPHYRERSREIPAFAESAAYRQSWLSVGTQEGAQGVEAMATSAGFFGLLRASPALGRTYTADETLAGSPHVVVLSDALWRQRFLGDPGVLGTVLPIDGEPYTVIGVMPATFRFPTLHPAAWIPLVFGKEEQTDEYRHALSLNMCARLRPGVSPAQAQAQLDALNMRTLKQDPFAKLVVEGAGFHAAIRGLQATMVYRIRPILLFLQVGALFLLVIGAVNLTNLIMIRAVGRAREYNVRRALGASSWRLVRSIILEILVLSFAGAAVGLALGLAVLRVSFQTFSDRLPFELSPAANPTVVAATLAGAALTGLLLSAPVVWQTLGANLASSIASESRTGTTTRSVQRTRQGLIVAQITLAFTLLAGTGLLSLSLYKILAVDPGFRPQHVLTGRFDLPAFRYSEARRREITLQVWEQARLLPGVSSAGISNVLPFTWSPGGSVIVFKDRKMTPQEGADPHPVIAVAGDLFKTLGIPLVQGRLIDDRDVGSPQKACVVDTVFAERYWPPGEALGRAITPDSRPNAEYYSIVGVVGAIKHSNLASVNELGSVYIPYAGERNVMVALRTAEDPAALGATLAKVAARIDPDLELVDVQLMANRIASSLSGRRVALALAGIYAGMALILAGTGIYGVLAYTVAQRNREIGVRMALGARPRQILRMVLHSGLRLLMFSLPLGVLRAAMLGYAMRIFLFNIGPLNLPVLALASLVLAGAATAACALPARRAARVAPSEALRTT